MANIASHSLDFNTKQELTSIRLIRRSGTLRLFVGRDKRKRGSPLEPPLFWPVVAEAPAIPLTTRSLASMHLLTAIRTRPSRIHLPISQQELVDKPRSATVRLEGKGRLWQSRSTNMSVSFPAARDQRHCSVRPQAQKERSSRDLSGGRHRYDQCDVSELRDSFHGAISGLLCGSHFSSLARKKRSGRCL